MALAIRFSIFGKLSVIGSIKNGFRIFKTCLLVRKLMYSVSNKGYYV